MGRGSGESGLQVRVLERENWEEGGREKTDSWHLRTEICFPLPFGLGQVTLCWLRARAYMCLVSTLCH